MGELNNFSMGKRRAPIDGPPLLTSTSEMLTKLDNSKPCIVPCLKEVHVLRDAWTKLNAKIMQVCVTLQLHVDYALQQEQVLTELYSYIH